MAWAGLRWSPLAGNRRAQRHDVPVVCGAANRAQAEAASAPERTATGLREPARHMPLSGRHWQPQC
jgi:hypothetical protein